MRRNPDRNALRVSFEFFPPRTESGFESLERVVGRLNETGPSFYSCTYGAGGTTRSGTTETIERLLSLGVNAAPHLSIGGDGKASIFEQLDHYRTLGVTRVVALRGDLPSGLGANRFEHNAESLIGWIREHSGNHFHIEVAAYPEVHPDASSPESDLSFLARKAEAGADSALTQYFFNPHAYYDFMNRCEQANLAIPIYPGIMPITNVEGLVRVSEKCSADIPRWLLQRMTSLADDDTALRAFGTEYLTRMCEELIANGAPGLHFYTLNRWGVSRAICRNLGLDQAES